MGSCRHRNGQREHSPPRSIRAIGGGNGAAHGLHEPPGDGQAETCPGPLAVARTHAIEFIEHALLTSISHDLRTPLAAILGSATSLKQYRDQLSEADQAQLLSTIQEEAERLNHFIANLLDMTRLESGAVAPRLEAVEIGDVVGSVLRRTKRLLAGHRVTLALDNSLPMAKLDPVLFEQVLFNLLDNAAKYTPVGSEVTVRAGLEGGRIRIDVTDEGEGLPEGERERVFDKFYRVRAGDSKRAGTGLGLSIARGFMEAMSGSIAAANRGDHRGASFTLMLPLA